VCRESAKILLHTVWHTLNMLLSEQLCSGSRL
jgi:hypothetical protein